MARAAALSARWDPAITVIIYVDASKEVGDPDHLKVFANVDAAETWLEENDPKGVAFEYARSWNEEVANAMRQDFCYGVLNSRQTAMTGKNRLIGLGGVWA